MGKLLTAWYQLLGIKIGGDDHTNIRLHVLRLHRDRELAGLNDIQPLKVVAKLLLKTKMLLLAVEKSDHIMLLDVVGEVNKGFVLLLGFQFQVGTYLE